MEAERWTQIEALFEAALARPPEKRAMFLAQACPDDLQLRGEVESLLAQEADSFLESAPVSAIKALSPGAKLGNFEIVELLGRGGMGEVWRARDARLNRDVAIKVLPAAMARDPDRIARFEREARAASALNHPNIVSVHDIGRDQDTYWIATELVAGEPLAGVIKRGPLAARKTIEIAAQIAGGLAAAHAAGIVHRDLKPANIMVARDGRVKILDFGLAKRRRVGADSTTLDLTEEGTVMGTAGYMSPEQVRGEELDQRSDLFSFGVILYEMLGGKRAFAGGSSVEVMNAILKEDPPELPAMVTPPLARIVSRSLEKDRERRFQSAADLAFALESILASQPAASPARRRPSWLMWTGVAVACLATAFAVRWWDARSRPVGIAAGATLRRLTADKGLTTDAAISADGKFVAYASDRADSSNLDIWVQQIGGGSAVRLTDDPADDHDPSISPDGSQVAFRSERNGAGVYVVPVLGGDARLLISKGRHPRFSPDGQMLMYSVGGGNSIGSYNELFVQRLSGGAPIQIGAGCAAYPSSAVWSPDSSRVLFDGTCSGQPDEAWVVTLGGVRSPVAGLNERVIDEWLANPSRLLLPFYRWGPDLFEGSISALPISADGRKITGPAERLTFGTEPERRASAAGGLIAISASNSEDHVWGVPVDATGHAIGAPRQLTSGSAHEYLAYLSRDGQKLLFNLPLGNHHQLYAKDLKTGKEQGILREGAWMNNIVLSPDLTKLVFMNDDSSSLYEAPIEGGFPKKIWEGPLWGASDWSRTAPRFCFFLALRVKNWT